ncbi:MAG TPA: NAD(P)H-dependent oxidoreductase [Methanoregula sp.]|nr:NAD(P)H-dependent oxidoreductase [Methanoregula sp.]
MTIRIAYYSWKGHTEKVATALAKLLDAELVRIEPVRDSGMAGKAMKAAFRMRSPIKPAKTDLAGIDTLVIASPVWAGRVPAYVNQYCDSVTGGTGKPFHVLVEMGGRGDQSAIAVVRKALEKKGMKFVSSASTVEKDVDSGSFSGTLEKFAAGIRMQ